jgi:Pectate lyase superfamily protein
MADMKVSQLATTTTTAATDLIYAVISQSATWVSRQMTVDDFFKSRNGNKNIQAYTDLATAVSTIGSATATIEIPASTTISADLTVPANITLLVTGAGQFSVNATKTLTINGGLVAGLSTIFTGSGSVRLGAKVPVAFPQWWGALADGSTDDSSAVAKAIAAYSSGGTVYFGAGTWIVSNITVSASNVNLVGAGIGATTLKLKNSTNTSVVTFSGSTSCALRNLTVDGNRTNNASNAVADVVLGTETICDAVEIKNSALYSIRAGLRAVVSNCKLTGSGAGAGATNGIWAALNDGSFDGFHVTGTTVKSYRGAGLLLDGRGVRVTDCTILDNAQDSGTIGQIANSNGGSLTIADCFIGGAGTGNTISTGSTTIGIVAAASSVTVEHCTIISQQSYGIYCSGGTGHIIEGNRISGCQSDGIRLSVSSFIVKGNYSNGNAAYGLNITSGTFNNYVVVGNNLASNTSGALSNSATGSTFFIDDNVPAVAGQRGEYLEASVAVGSALALTTVTSKTITSITLTNGDWEVNGAVIFATGNTYTELAMCYNTTTNTFDSTVGKFNDKLATVVTGGTYTLIGPTTRFSVATSTTVYLIAYASFSSGSASAYGIIRARRV